MIEINGKQINNYEDYHTLTGEDLIAFMRNQSAEDIIEFKNFCATPKITKYTDGSEKEHETNFFEMRNWILDKYAPGIRIQSNKKRQGKKLIDMIMEL